MFLMVNLMVGFFIFTLLSKIYRKWIRQKFLWIKLKLLIKELSILPKKSFIKTLIFTFMNFRIHKEGQRFLLITLVVLFLINLLGYFLVHHAFLYILIISVIFLGFMMVFFRNPKREINMDDKSVLAPADGKVVMIEEVEEPEYFKDKRLQISIFMSPLDVHANKNPVSGVVRYLKYHPGKYLVAWHRKSSTKNERQVMVIKSDHTEIMIKQIAGAVARRVVNYLKPGEKVVQGNDLGFIKFGSRADVLLPLNASIQVKLNQKVKAGMTVLARIS